MNIKSKKIKSHFPILCPENNQVFKIYVFTAKILKISNIILGLWLIPTTVKAQNITPGNDGTGTVVNTQGNNINISGGSLSSDQANLFHSFTKFGLDANQTANFLSLPSIQNILGRVTGGEASLINGLIRVTGGNSNLYLINPAGIIFGQNASLNVPASFSATTANRLGFGNDNWLNAVGTNDYSQLIGTPNSFAFDGSVASAIFNQGNLAVPSGNNLSLFAGTVASTGTLSAPGGNITIATVPGSSLLRLSMVGNPLSLELQPPNTTDANLTGNSLPALLTGGNVGSASGLVVDNGEVKLTGSGLKVENGDVVSTSNIVAGTTTINAIGNITTENISTADSISGIGGAVNLIAGGNITTNNIDTSAAIVNRFEPATGGAVTFIAGGNITTNNINTSTSAINRFNTAIGGAVTFIAGGNITTNDINTSTSADSFGIATGGAVTLLANDNIRTNNIDTSVINFLGNAIGGGVNLISNSNVIVGSINTAATSFNVEIPALTQGGDVNVLANGTVRVVGEIFDRNQPTSNSIFTGALNQPGTVTIQHDGGVNNVPFIVGDASLNGTAAAINVSDRTNSQITANSAFRLFPVRPLGGTTDGTPSRISIISVNTPPTLSVGNNVINAQPNNSVTFNVSSLNVNINDINNDNYRIVFDSILSGSLNLQDGTPVTPRTILDRNTVLVYTPPQGSVGQIPAFTIKASDGVSESVAQQININVTSLSKPPIIPNNPNRVEPQPNNVLNPQPNSLLNVDLNQFVNREKDEIIANLPIVDKDEYLLEPALEADINEDISKIDDRFTNQFTQYLGTNKPTAKTIEESRKTLLNIEAVTDVKPALIYISFIPKSLKNNVLREENVTPRGDDVLELILLTGKGAPIRRILSNVTRSQVLVVSQIFTNNITSRSSAKKYLVPSQQLYKWLIAPLRYNLQARKINNLVFITDTGLRSLPIAALSDGQKYLIENYSIGLMPSFTLTDTKYVDIRKAEVLGMGASQFTNLEPLPSVPSELTTITQRLWLGRTFLNEAFTLGNLKAQRQQKAFGIVHLATHGEFKSGEAGNSYIQLWDSQLRMNQIRQLGWNQPPVELVVLSACRTALGDEEAEFGFAGFAVQSGAKSALASLWTVSDEGTFGLMTQFYEKLKQAPIKAEALRRAQLAMLKGEVRLEMGRLRTARGDVPLPEVLVELGDKTLTHPYFWSAFTMIGNPW